MGPPDDDELLPPLALLLPLPLLVSAAVFPLEDDGDVGTSNSLPLALELRLLLATLQLALPPLVTRAVRSIAVGFSPGADGFFAKFLPLRFSGSVIRRPKSAFNMLSMLNLRF